MDPVEIIRQRLARYEGALWRLERRRVVGDSTVIMLTEEQAAELAVLLQSSIDASTRMLLAELRKRRGVP